jgi:predicted nuclease of restriction endonuclease-like (RecB) superfamily
MDRLQAFLLELGHGFAFIGRQYRLKVDDDEFHMDMLLFDWIQARFSRGHPMAPDRLTPGNR